LDRFFVERRRPIFFLSRQRHRRRDRFDNSSTFSLGHAKWSSHADRAVAFGLTLLIVIASSSGFDRIHPIGSAEGANRSYASFDLLGGSEKAGFD
jgi:hypothetical protein